MMGMRRFIQFTLIALVTFSDCYAQTDSLHSYIRSLVLKNHSGSLNEDELTTLRAYGYGLENKAFLLAAQKSSPENALSATDSALQFWVSIDESGHEATLRQLRGDLLRQLNRNREARNEVLRSIELYQDLKMANHVAVSMHEMCLVLEQSGIMDSAIWYQLQATDYWIMQEDLNQIVAGKNHLIHLYIKAGNFAEASKIQVKTENELTIEMDWKPTIDFYYLSYQLYKSQGNAERADRYFTLYQNWLKKQQEEGVEVRSEYE
jgi:hypothetical protein